MDILIAAVILTGLGVFAVLVLVLVGIHDEDRRMSLPAPPVPASKRSPAGCSASASVPPDPAPAPRFLPGAICHDRLDPARHLPRHRNQPGAHRPPPDFRPGPDHVQAGRPAPGYGRQPAPPRWPGDRSGLWLRNAAAGLCLLAAAAAAVSFTAQYRMVDATRHLPVVAALEAAIPDAAALVFGCLGIALALHGRRAIRARALNLASVGTSVFMNAIAAGPGWRNLAIWAMPPHRLRPGQRHLDRRRPGLDPGPPPAADRRAGRRGGHPAGRAWSTRPTRRRSKRR